MKAVTIEVTLLVEDEYDLPILSEAVEGGLNLLAQDGSDTLEGVLEYGATYLSSRDVDD